MRQVLVEVELEPADGSCDLVDNSEDDSDDCPDFEAPPRFLDLPLDGTPIEVMTALVPPGTYDELEFEIEDLEDDEEDPEEAAAILALRTQILSEIPDWPEKASALVAGTFQPTGGAAVDFRVFLDAEVEVEMDILPNLVIGDDGNASRSVTVDIRPDIWFKNADGTVLPLSDYDTTQMLLEFELEMEDGFTEIEIDIDD